MKKRIVVICVGILCVGLHAGAQGQTKGGSDTNELSDAAQFAGIPVDATAVETESGRKAADVSTDVASAPLSAAASVKDDTKAVADTAPRKARVVVVPAIYSRNDRPRWERELKEKWGIGDFSIMENPGYTTFLVDALVNSRKLDVLERADLPSVLKEIDFGESDYASAAKAVRIGQMLNADYVVLPEITFLEVPPPEAKEIPYVGQTRPIYKARISTSVRTVDVKTSKIVSSHMDGVELKRRFRERDLSADARLGKVVAQLYSESALKEASHIVDTAYPIRVVAVAERTVVLNRGQGAVRDGEIFNVYEPGEVMVDPDTKETLGYHEARVGQVRVAKVDQKTCTAEILEGAGAIQKLNVCRRDVKPAPVAEQPAPNLE